MTIDFPNSPTNGQIFQNWKYDGTKWVSIGGTKGVTDGSNAAAGQVGEYLSATSASVAVTVNAWQTGATITLSAGDWELEGTATLTPATSFNSMQVGFAGAVNTPPSSQIARIDYSGGGLGVCTLVVPSWRVNVTAPQAIYVSAFLGTGGTNGNLATSISARRVR